MPQVSHVDTVDAHGSLQVMPLRGRLRGGVAARLHFQWGWSFPTGKEFRGSSGTSDSGLDI